MRTIAQSVGVGHTTVGEYLRRTAVIGITWPIPPEVDDAELERRLFTARGFYAAPTRVLPEWNHIHAELRRRGVTLLLLWEEYRAEHPEGYGYSRFCSLYIGWRRGVSATMRQTHVAGEKLFVDYAGVSSRCSKPLSPRKASSDPTSGGVALLLTTAAQELALGRMELTDLWGVARRTAEKLQALGITTPLQLRDADPRFLRERFSVVLERTVHELRGTPCIAFEDVTPNRKSIVASRSFGRPVLLATEMAEAVATYTARAAEKMRRQGLATANLVVFLETNRFRPDDLQHCASQAVQLPVATADTGKLTAATLRGLAPIWRIGFSYKKAGVMFLDLVPAASVQAGLFDAPDSPARQRLMGIIDRLNARHGRDTISFARSGRQRAWKLRSEHHSPRYTTSWEELLRVG